MQPNGKSARCSFEFVYFSRPDSDWDGKNVHQVRQRLGEELAREAPIDADVVIGVPDSSLPAELIEWLRTVVKPRLDDPRGIVILSHHQYVSRFDHCYPKPAQQLAEFFSRPVLWLWGHEHRLAIYEEAAMEGGVTAFGRCIGHGGMPVDLPPKDTTTKPPLHDFAVEFLDDRLYPNDENLVVGYNGFAMMTLRDDQLTLDYVDLRGTRVFSETWRVEQGKLVRLKAGRD